jgi:hypothetical protein
MLFWTVMHCIFGNAMFVNLRLDRIESFMMGGPTFF